MKKEKKLSIDEKDPEARACPTCTEAQGRLGGEFPCTLAKVVIGPGNVRVKCVFWRQAKKEG